MNPSDLREISGFKLIGYSLTFLGLFLNNVFYSVFIFQFYVYTINLDSILVSIGIAIKSIVAAVISVIAGVVADNKKPLKLGKRRVLMLYGIPIWFISNLLIWNPPWYCPEKNSLYFPTALFFWIVIMTRAVSGSFIMTVHVSMIPEQSQTHVNRKKIASWNAIFSIIASVISLMFPLIIQSFLEDPENVKWWEQSGKIILIYIPIIGYSFAILGVITFLITFFSINEKFHLEIYNNNHQRKVKDAFRQLLKPAQDKNFKKFIVVRFCHSTAGKILGIVIIPFLTYALKFKSTDFFIYIVVSITCKFGWFFFWKFVLRRKGLKTTYCIIIIIMILAGFLDLIFLFENLSFTMKIILFVLSIGTILGSIYSFSLFTTPLTGALVHEEASKNDSLNLDSSISQISGSYFGLQTFIESLGIAFASLMVGAILTGPNQENAAYITLCLFSMNIFYIISLFFLWQINLKDESMEGKK